MKATIKPGDKLWSPETGPCVAIPSSPGSLPAADEEALARLTEAVEYLSPRVVLPVIGGGTETLRSLCFGALYKLRSRLARLADAEPHIVSDWDVAERLAWLEGCDTDEEKWDAIEEFLRQEFNAKVRW